MLRRLLRLCVLVVLALALSAPGLNAQTASTTEADQSEHSSPALPYAFALLYTLLVLTIVCMPSRKA